MREPEERAYYEGAGSDGLPCVVHAKVACGAAQSLRRLTQDEAEAMAAARRARESRQASPVPRTVKPTDSDAPPDQQRLAGLERALAALIAPDGVFKHLEQRLNRIEAAKGPSLDQHMRMIDEAGAIAIDRIREAAEQAAATLAQQARGAEGAGNAAPQPSPGPLPPAPATEPQQGWVKDVLQRVDEEDGMPQPVTNTEAPAPQPVTATFVADTKTLRVDDEPAKAEVRYQLAIQALNGSVYAKQLLAGPAGRRGVSVEALATAILEERRQTEQRVMAEF